MPNWSGHCGSITFSPTTQSKWRLLNVATALPRSSAVAATMAARPMCQDKQLRGVTLKDVLKKRQLEQALNVKEFAVLAGISYSTARAWFRLAGFPVFRGHVFWQDFVQWRHHQTGLGETRCEAAHRSNVASCEPRCEMGINLPIRAARILSEAA